MPQPEKNVIARHKKAFADFHILESKEAGMVLKGYEMKSIRQGKVNLKGSFVHIFNGQAWAEGIHIAPYAQNSDKNYNPTRQRKLLLHKQEITKLESHQNEKGKTIIPLELYLKKGRAKLQIALAQGKKQYDRRDELKKRDQDREIRKILKYR